MESTCSSPRNNEIHNPTLLVMHICIALTLFPRDDVRPIRQDELRILFAMVKKIKASHVQPMIKQWLENFRMFGSIKCTSFVTRIASNIGVLNFGVLIPFI